MIRPRNGVYGGWMKMIRYETPAKQRSRIAEMTEVCPRDAVTVPLCFVERSRGCSPAPLYLSVLFSWKYIILGGHVITGLSFGRRIQTDFGSRTLNRHALFLTLTFTCHARDREVFTFLKYNFEGVFSEVLIDGSIPSLSL